MNYLVNQRWNVRMADVSLQGFLGLKHNSNADFGYPTHPQFADFYELYQRNGLAHAGVDKTAAKTWQDFPFVLEKPRDGGEARKETEWEKLIRERFGDLRVWQHLAEADRRGMVGAYAGLILRVGDGKPLNQPVKGKVRGGLDGLVEVIPAWEAQLTVSQWDTDQTSPTYGQPVMFQFNEAAVGTVTQPRNFDVHPDRVLIWSRDATVHGDSALKAGMNDAIAAAKIVGAGGEGFWKNAKSSPVLQAPPEADLSKMAKALGCTVAELYDLMNEQVDSWQRGFDQLLMLQGMEAKALGITLPSPEHFFSIACQSFAASLQMPVKILVGMQTGERASTEDAEEWAQTIMSRRAAETIPNIMAFVRRLERFGMIPELDWSLAWTPLTEAKPAEKIDRAAKMVTANKDSVAATQERVFTNAEIRAAAGDFEPLSEAEAKVEKPEPAADPQADPQQRGNQGGGRAAVVPFVSNAKRRRLRRGRAKKGFDPSQPRGADGRWIDTGQGESKSLAMFLRSRRKDPGRQRTLDLGAVKNQTAISAAGGPDTRGYRRIIETHEANHALNEHGPGSPKWLRGSRLGKADLARIEEVVAASEPLKVVRKKGGDVRIEYRATIGKRTYRYFETVSKRRSALIFKTMWWEE